MEWGELINRINKALYKIDGTLVCDGTHRFMESDGFYELQFTLVLPDIEIYLTTMYDYDGEIENTYSPNNPQVCYCETLTGIVDQDSLEDILTTLEDYINGNYKEDDYRFSKRSMQYDYLLGD